MANLVSTLVSTVKSSVRVVNNVAQMIEVGVYYTEGFTGEMKDSIGKTPEEAKDTGHKHASKVIEVSKDTCKKVVDVISINNESENEKPKIKGRPKKSS